MSSLEFMNLPGLVQDTTVYSLLASSLSKNGELSKTNGLAARLTVI